MKTLLHLSANRRAVVGLLRAMSTGTLKDQKALLRKRLGAELQMLEGHEIARQCQKWIMIWSNH